MQLLLLTRHQLVKLLAEVEFGDLVAGVGVGVGAAVGGGGCQLASRVYRPQRTGPQTPLMMNMSRKWQGCLEASMLL